MRIIALICLSLVACDDGGSGGEGGAGGVGGAGGGGGVGGAVEAALAIVVEEGDALIPVEDGASVGYEWGFQGGTMIRPAVLLPIEQVAGLEEVRLTVRHRADPDHPEAFGDAGDFAGVILDLPIDPYDDDYRVVGPVDQQLGWTDLAGVRLLLDVTVTGPDFELRDSVRLAVEGEAGPCDVFPQEGMGCVYHTVPGSYVVDHFEPGECADAMRPRLRFVPESRAAEVCISSTGLEELAARPLDWPGLESADPACLAEMGFDVGGRLLGGLAVQINGGCSPIQVEVETDASACAISCF